MRDKDCSKCSRIGFGWLGVFKEDLDKSISAIEEKEDNKAIALIRSVQRRLEAKFHASHNEEANEFFGKRKATDPELEDNWENESENGVYGDES